MKKYSLFLALYILFITPLLASGAGAGLDDQVPEDTKRIKVLSWDGGGVRGLFSLHIAKAIQGRLGGGVTLADKADWQAGTSTGGIIALALSNGSTLDEAIELYEKHGDKIFKKAEFSCWQSFKGLFEETYSAKGLETLLKETLGDSTFGNLQGRQNNVVITSYDIEGGVAHDPSPYIFNSQELDFYTVKLWEAARATSAAPTYFEPYYGFAGHSLVDGGLVANHPGAIAIEEITGLADHDQRDDVKARIDMISFGTGSFNPSIPRAHSKSMGKIDWASPISGVIMDANIEAITQNLQTALGGNYVRLNMRLDQEIPLDGVSPAEIAALQDLAQGYIKQNPESIEAAAKLILK